MIIRKHLMLSLLPLLFVACSASGSGIKTETVSLDSGNTPGISFEMKVELPVSGQGVVTDKIRTKLIDLMDSDLSDDHNLFSAFDGDPGKTGALVKYYFFKASDCLAKEAAEQESSIGDIEKAFNITKGLETERYVIFELSDYLQYPGATMSMWGNRPLTFDKSDGSLFESFLKKGLDLYQIQPILEKGLAGYFDVKAEDVRDELMLEDYTIPLPGQTPRPSRDSLHFTYGKYEISYGNAGTPYFGVPYTEVLHFLSPEAKRLLFGWEDATEELASTAAALCEAIPEHGVSPDAEELMTPEYFRAVSEAFDAPSGAYGEIGDDEWLYYFLAGNDPPEKFRFIATSVLKASPTVAYADFLVQDVWDGQPTGEPRQHMIEMTLKDGKWLLSDFDDTRRQCIEYVKGKRAEYASGSIIKSLEDDEYTKEFVPDFKKAVEEFYKKYGR